MLFFSVSVLSVILIWQAAAISVYFDTASGASDKLTATFAEVIKMANSVVQKFDDNDPNFAVAFELIFQAKITDTSTVSQVRGKS